MAIGKHVALVLAAAMALAACGGEARAPDQPISEFGTEGAVVGLSTSLPLFWAESADIGDLLNGGKHSHWTLDTLGAFGTVRPLDTLADDHGALPLPQDALLVMAQPWPLSPQENVALDTWVRSGGRVLLFADPMLTFESQFALGDRRRPQDIVLLSPILRRWGLELRFDDEQPAGERRVEVAGASMPVNLPGQFAVMAAGPRDCGIESEGLLADCRIGRGRVLAIADAALLETSADGADSQRVQSLNSLLDRLAR